MSYFTKFIIFTALILIEVNLGSALKCWYCSSDSIDSKFCDEPFNPNNLTDYERNISYIDCNAPIITSDSEKPACRKMVLSIGEKVVTSRSCSMYNEAEPDDCLGEDFDAQEIVPISCRVCYQDGCNGDDF